MNHHINILFDYKLINIAHYDVCFCRLMSQLADVNIQSSVGMFSFYVFLYSSFCFQICTRLIVLCSERRHFWTLFFPFSVSHLATAIHVVDNTKTHMFTKHVLYLAMIFTMSSIGIGTHHWYGSLPKLAKDLRRSYCTVCSKTKYPRKFFPFS